MTEQNKKFETPVSDEAEQQVIGALFLDGTEVLKRVSHILKPEDFYYQSHRIIYEGAVAIAADKADPDIITLGDYLKSMGQLEKIGGYTALTKLADNVVTTTRVANYARIVQKYSTMRRILDAARAIGKMTQDSSMEFDDLLNKAEEKLKGVTRDTALQQDRLEIVDLQDYMTLAREHREPEGTIKGMSTGLYKIDKMTQGFVPGELMIISGQTSHGKTQLTNNIMLHAAKADHKIMFITMEMTKQETADRFNTLTQDQDIGHGKIFLNMRSDLAYTDITKMVERAKERGCDMVVIDHLHYFSRSVENATQEVSKIVKEFKGAAVQYEIPIILICHVRKMPPKKHPTLEDLRDSSLIAQDADMVLMVWRDESPSVQDPNEVEVTLWKNRNRQKRHRRDFLYAEGLTLSETDNKPPDAKQQEVIDSSSDLSSRITGEKDLDDLDLGGISETDISISPA